MGILGCGQIDFRALAPLTDLDVPVVHRVQQEVLLEERHGAARGVREGVGRDGARHGAALAGLAVDLQGTEEGGKGPGQSVCRAEKEGGGRRELRRGLPSLDNQGGGGVEGGSSKGFMSLSGTKGAGLHCGG